MSKCKKLVGRCQKEHDVEVHSTNFENRLVLRLKSCCSHTNYCFEELAFYKKTLRNFLEQSIDIQNRTLHEAYHVRFKFISHLYTKYHGQDSTKTLIKINARGVTLLGTNLWP